MDERRGPARFIIRKHRVQDRDPKVWKGFANCSGASGAKPFEVKQNADGKWRMFGASSFFAGTEDPPAAEAPRGPR